MFSRVLVNRRKKVKALANFCGVNTPVMAGCKLPVWYCWARIREGMDRQSHLHSWHNPPRPQWITTLTCACTCTTQGMCWIATHSLSKLLPQFVPFLPHFLSWMLQESHCAEPRKQAHQYFSSKNASIFTFFVINTVKRLPSLWIN